MVLLAWYVVAGASFAALTMHLFPDVGDDIGWFESPAMWWATVVFLWPFIVAGIAIYVARGLWRIFMDSE